MRASASWDPSGSLSGPFTNASHRKTPARSAQKPSQSRCTAVAETEDPTRSSIQANWTKPVAITEAPVLWDHDVRPWSHGRALPKSFDAEGTGMTRGISNWERWSELAPL
jgi:hypothetical protein